MRNTLLASAVSPFAHLIGRAPAAAAPAAPAAPVAVPAATKKAEEGQETEDEKKDREDKERRKREKDAGRDEDDDGEDADGKKGKKASKAEGDSDSDDDDGDDASAHAIRMRERGRCRAIFAHPAAGVRPDVAAQLAFGTGLNRAEAIATLQAVAGGQAAEPAGRQSLRSSMAAVPSHDLGAPAGDVSNQDPAKATAEAILAAGKRRRGEKV